MLLFYFVLKAGRQTIPDPEGQELIDEAAARLHALAVAQQLMRHRETDTRGWRIQVCDDYLVPLFEVFFAEVDQSLDKVRCTFNRPSKTWSVPLYRCGADRRRGLHAGHAQRC